MKWHAVPSRAQTLSTLLPFLLLFGLPAASTAQDTAYPLSGLIVTASPTPRAATSVATNVTVLDVDILRRRGLVTVAEALRGVAGLSVTRNGSFGAATSLFMRGAESDHVLVLVDGVQVNQPGGAFDFSSLLLANVERIEIPRGPASALHGSDAVAGVIHIITKSGGGAPGGEIRSRVGSFGRRDWTAEFSGGDDRAGYTLGLTRLATDGILAFNNHTLNTVFNGRARFSPDPRTQADLSFRLGDSEFHLPTDGSGNVVDRNAFTYGDETLLGLRLLRSVASDLSWEARIGVVDTDGGFTDAADDAADSLGFFGFNSLDNVRRATVDMRAHWSPGRTVLTAGWEFETERQRSFTESLSQYGSSAENSEYSRLNRAYYGHLTGSRGELAFNAGARLEDNERFGTSGTWQFGAAWALPGSPDVRLRASAGRSLKEPTFYETFATGFARGNADLKPETGRSWEAGLDGVVLSGKVRLSGTWFAQSFSNLIQYTFSPPTQEDPNFFNVASAESRGFELETTFESGAVQGGASWTWLDTKVTDAGFDTGLGAAFVEGESLLRRPRHKFEAYLAAELGLRAGVSADVSVIGTRSDRNFSTFPAERVTLGRYTNLSLGGSWTLIPGKPGRAGFTLTARSENVLDRSFHEVFGFRAPGRGLYLGGTLTFGNH